MEPNKFFKGCVLGLPLFILAWAVVIGVTVGMFRFVLWVIAR